MIEGAAAARTASARTIWQESSFRPGVSSGAGAQGVAQFMPAPRRSAALPIRSIPSRPFRSRRNFSQICGNGSEISVLRPRPTWRPGARRSLARGRGSLPGETRNYVSAVTGRLADDWADEARGAKPAEPAQEAPPTRCLVLVAAFRRGTDRRMIEAYAGPIDVSPIAPWGVQLAGNFSKDRALASFARARQRHAAILSDVARW